LNNLGNLGISNFATQTKSRKKINFVKFPKGHKNRGASMHKQEMESNIYGPHFTRIYRNFI
jgi:hypothetical protein